MRKRWLSRVAAALLIAAGGAAPGLAQDDEEPSRFIDVPHLADTKPWPQWIAASLFVVGGIAVAFKHPRRGHLD